MGIRARVTDISKKCPAASGGDECFGYSLCIMRTNCFKYIILALGVLLMLVIAFVTWYNSSNIDGLVALFVSFAVMLSFLLHVELQLDRITDIKGIKLIYQKEVQQFGTQYTELSNKSLSDIILGIEEKLNDHRIVDLASKIIAGIGLSGFIAMWVGDIENIFYCLMLLVVMFFVIAMEVKRMNEIENIIRAVAQKDYIEMQNK